jgi:hypothetical protein
VPETTGTRKPSSKRVVEELPPPAHETEDPVCTVAFCPICMAVTATRGLAPEAIDHLLSAAREFFLAARTVIDIRGDDLAGEGKPKKTRLEKIEIA